jgi:hypothetical protein
MSFDIFFQTFVEAGPPVEQKNPFTGKTESVPSFQPLSAAELKAVREILRRAKAHREKEGNYLVEFADGGRVEIYADDLATGFMAALRRVLTPELTQFLFDLLQAGNWVLLATADNPTLATSPDRLADLPPELSPGKVCHSAEELATFLTRGFTSSWEKYRDQARRNGS